MQDQQVVSVADGMGGAAAGEIASKLFVTAVQDFFSTARISSEEAVYQIVQRVFNVANKRIIEHATRNPGDVGMGCTGELLAFANGRYIIGHVGDSRIYLLRNGKLRQLTKDHSLVQLQLDRGTITAEEARVHPKKNIVLRAVGMELDFSLDMLRGNSFVDDLFLLCSDGLTDMIKDEAISAILVSSCSLVNMAEQLIKSAKNAGGKDNITVVLCKVTGI